MSLEVVRSSIVIFVWLNVVDVVKVNDTQKRFIRRFHNKILERIVSREKMQPSMNFLMCTYLRCLFEVATFARLAASYSFFH